MLLFNYIFLGLCTIYRQPTYENALVGDVIKETKYFADCPSCTESLVVGDFNIYFESPDPHDVKRFYTLSVMELQQKADNSLRS